VDEITPPPVVFARRLGGRDPGGLEVGLLIIETIAGRQMGIAPSNVQELARGVGARLARRAIRASHASLPGQVVRHWSMASSATSPPSRYQEGSPNRSFLSALVSAPSARYDESVKEVAIAPTFEAWQAAARALLREDVAPAEVRWRDDAPTLELVGSSGGEAGPAPGPAQPVTRVPRQFIELAGQVARHSDPGRWALLYEVLWRLVHQSRELLKAGADPQVRRLFALAAQVRREAYQAEVAEMLQVQDAGPGAAAFVPAGAGLAELRQAATRCTGCDLYRHATQMVFGRGPADARIVLVGEQPGDQEDLQGAPFVGPAGEVLDRALAEAGLAREQLYVTNAVKHFKFVERGKRRIHQTPRLAEIAACRPWLEAELAVLEPEVLVGLGATAARALFGPDFRLMRERGRLLGTRWTPKTLATLHPSAVLRGEDEPTQARLYRMLVDDLRLAAEAAAGTVSDRPAPSGG
jgi:DNA polymerase